MFSMCARTSRSRFAINLSLSLAGSALNGAESFKLIRTWSTRLTDANIARKGKNRFISEFKPTNDPWLTCWSDSRSVVAASLA